jgi:hypothetical protein
MEFIFCVLIKNTIKRTVNIKTGISKISPESVDSSVVCEHTVLTERNLTESEPRADPARSLRVRSGFAFDNYRFIFFGFLYSLRIHNHVH